jgi:hypothetical protein
MRTTQSNGIKISGELKKMIEANNKGELEAYLKLKNE